VAFTSWVLQKNGELALFVVQINDLGAVKHSRLARLLKSSV
jgi:hypothetical protein